MSKAKPIPNGYCNVTPYLVVKDAARAIEFYKAAFGAIELTRLPAPNGRIGHAEIKIGNSLIMLADEHPEIGARSPDALGGSPVSLLLYVEDVDAVARRAVAGGARLLCPLKDQFYGDRSGTLVDPFGHQWQVATHVEDLEPEEMRRRAAAATRAAASS
jgi:PhnB protein